jgi:hypothetical protein
LGSNCRSGSGPNGKSVPEQMAYILARMNPIITLTVGYKSKWTEDEDTKLKDAVQTYGDKDWVAAAALSLGRTGSNEKTVFQ